MDATVPAPHLTKLEDAWNHVPTGYRVSLQRSDRYDPTKGLFFSPAEYSYVPVGTHTFTLEPEDLATRLNSLIHPGLTDEDMPVHPPKIETIPGRYTVSEEILHQLLRNCEGGLVFGGTIDELLSAYRDDRTRQIQALLSHPLLGNRRNRDNLDYEALTDLVSSCLRDRLPFQLVVPAFPFKDQNPFRSSCAPSHWDIGEAALLMRLHCIALALNQLHAYDGECLVVSDGRAYSSIFGIRESAASEYLQSLRELRNSLNMQKTVHLIDLKFIMGKVDRNFCLEGPQRRIVGLGKIIEYVEDQLDTLCRHNDQAKLRLYNLERSMIWNIDTQNELVRVGSDDLWRAMNTKCRRIDPSVIELRHELSNRGRRAALKYAAFSLTLSASEFWAKMFPSSIRGTVHAKPGQAVIPKLGRGDPWNAVGVIDDARLRPDAVRTIPLWKIKRSDYRPVYFAGSSDPIAFVRKHLVSELTSW